MNPIMSMLNAVGPDSLPFAIRVLLDGYTNYDPYHPMKHNADISRFVTNNIPFIVPLSNALEAIDGWPDTSVESRTTEGGYFGENQTYVAGSDFHMGTHDLTLHFKEVSGSIIMSLLFYWIMWMALVARGDMSPYPTHQIAARRLSYTCSIYRFTLDLNRQYIRHWSRAWGCYPVMVPDGALFNYSEGESHVSAANKFSVNFKVGGGIRKMHPNDFKDFNKLMMMFNGSNYTSGKVIVPMRPEFNMKGIPYIDTRAGLNEFMWLADPQDLINPYAEKYTTLKQQIMERMSRPSSLISEPEAIPTPQEFSV
jgi:hypothetical protein